MEYKILYFGDFIFTKMAFKTTKYFVQFYFNLPDQVQMINATGIFR